MITIKKKLILFIGLILLIFSGQVFADTSITVPQNSGEPLTYTVNMNGSSSNTNVAAIPLTIPKVTATNVYALTTDANIRVKLVYSDGTYETFSGAATSSNNYWAPASQSRANFSNYPTTTNSSVGATLYIQYTDSGTPTGNVVIGYGTDGSEATVATFSLVGTQPTSGVTFVPNNGITTSVGNPSGPYSIEPNKIPVASASDYPSSVSKGVGYAFNTVIEITTNTADPQTNIGTLSSPNTNGATNLTLADSDSLLALPLGTNGAVCASFAYTTSTQTGNIDVYKATDLVINPIITELVFDPGASSVKTPFTYTPGGGDNYAAYNARIPMFSNSQGAFPNNVSVLSSEAKGSVGDDPNLNVVLTNTYPDTANSFIYGSGDPDDGTLNYQNQVTLSSSNTNVATLTAVPNNTTSPYTIKFTGNPGTSQITASANTGSSTVTSRSQGNYYNQFVLINTSSSVIPLTGIAFTSNPITVYNYDPALDQTVDTGFSVSPESGEIPDISYISFTITSVDNPKLTATVQGDNAIVSPAGLTGFSFDQSDPGQPIILNYDGSSPAEAGNYTLQAKYTLSNGSELTAQTTITVVDSETEPEVYVTYQNNNIVPGSPAIVDQTQTKSIQLGYSATGIDEIQSVSYSFYNGTRSSQTYPIGGTTPQAIINEQTGLITLLSPLPVGTNLPVAVTINGISSAPSGSNSCYVNIIGTEQAQTGLQAIQPTIYLPVQTGGSTFSYDLGQNVLNLSNDTILGANPTASDYVFYISPSTIKGVTLTGDQVQITKDCVEGTQFQATVALATNQKISATYNIEVVEELAATGITTTPSLELYLSTMDSGQIIPTLQPQGATQISGQNGEFIYFLIYNSATGGTPDLTNTTCCENNINNVVYVNSSTGEVTPIGAGTATVITAYYENGSDGDLSNADFTAQTQVTVVEGEPLTAITATPDSVTLQPQGTQTVTVTTTPSGMASQVNWTNSNPAVASFTKGDNGNLTITGLTVGTTTLTGTVGEISETITVTVTEEPVEPETITLSPNPIYLTSETGPGATSSQQMTATFSPAGDYDVTWSISPTTVATVSEDGIVTAVSPGTATVTATVGDVTGTAQVIVNDELVIYDGIEVNSQTPDEFSVTAKNVRTNPALDITGGVQQVAIFTWSTSNQSDMQCHVATPMGNGDYTWTPFNVNDLNTNYTYADNIYINVYGSIIPNDNGNYLGAANYKWLNDGNAQGYNDGYIAYSQDIAFDKPTVLSGLNTSTDVTNPVNYSGTVGEHRQMEGVRISSNIPGVEVNTAVHVENLGWQSAVGDGTYAGTMHRNLQIESVNLTLSGSQAPNYTIQYRVHQENVGWTSWVSSGDAGITGQHLQLEAIQLRIVPVGTALPTN